MKKDRAEYNEYMAAYMANRYKERRAAILAQLGNRCYQCGSVKMLKIDHIKKAWKRIDLSRRLTGTPWWLLQQELMACQLLCRDCHTEKMRTERSTGHGCGLTGVRNCYCDLCKPLKQKYNRNRRVRIAIEEVLGSVPQLADGADS